MEKLISAKIPNADVSVLSAAYDEDSQSLYYSTYDGKIWKYEAENADICLYDSDDEEGSIPQKISYADGVLYVTDIGLRDTICLDPQKGTVSRFAVEEERLDREIAYNLCADHGLVTVTSYSVLLWSGEEYEQLWDVPISPQIQRRILAVWIALILAVFAGLYLLAWLLYYVFVCSNIYTKVAFVIASGVVALSLILTGTLFPGIQEQLLDGIYDRINLAASITLEELPVDSFQKLRKPSDFMNEDYKKVQQALSKVFFVGSEEAEDLYCVMYQVIDGTVTLSYTIEDISSTYPYDWELDEGMQKVMDYGQTQRYTSNTSSGSYLFTHNPIYDETGSVCGIIEVGTDLKNVYSQLSRIFVLLAINVIAMTVVAIMFVIELMYYVKGRSEYKRQKPEVSSKPLPAEIFRFIVFLIFFFTNLTCAILPLHAMRLSKTAHAFGLSPTMLAAIPISAEVVSGAVFSAIGGRIINKLGTKRSVYVSSVIFTVGLAIRVIPDIWVLTLSSVLLGVGWGILLLLVNTMIAVLPEEEKDKGYTYYSVSSLSGANCAIVFGGFLVQWVSYSVLFAITAVLSIVLFFVSRKYLTREVSQDLTASEDGQDEKGRMSLIAFLFKPRIIGFFVLMLVPL
ncbi:MAG: MFS transporter, partial [Lachnospiraceae bacterium]|nr:MFS transporter [Lachnospiraceae bacterium]